ncbi:MAG: class A beta-lactamase-related serine hydrolase [Cyclobacteriaceae bacterium]
MRKKVLAAVMTLLSVSAAFGQKNLDNISLEIRAMIEDFNGNAGFYMKDLESGKSISFRADTIFPTASMIKIPILISVMDKVARGELDYREKLVYKDSLYYAGDDILGSFKDGEEIALDKLIMLMLTMSDNTASLWLQHIGGTGERINELMRGLGLEHTRMNSRTPGRRSNWEQYGWGQSTPREMANLLEMIWKHKVIDHATSERMLRNLKRNYWDGEALSVLPSDVNTYSKNGAVSQSRSEVVVVNACSTDYVFCVMTSDQQDDSWDYDNEGWVLIRDISRLLFEYFEPMDSDRPTADDRYK